MSVDYDHMYVSFLISASFLVYFIFKIFWIYVIPCVCILLSYKVVKKVLTSKLSLKGKAILITGCDTGQFGMSRGTSKSITRHARTAKTQVSQCIRAIMLRVLG